VALILACAGLVAATRGTPAAGVGENTLRVEVDPRNVLLARIDWQGEAYRPCLLVYSLRITNVGGGPVSIDSLALEGRGGGRASEIAAQRAPTARLPGDCGPALVLAKGDERLVLCDWIEFDAAMGGRRTLAAGESLSASAAFLLDDAPAGLDPDALVLRVKGAGADVGSTPLAPPTGAAASGDGYELVTAPERLH
jgi:hypothetical protein